MICPNPKCKKQNPDDNVFCEYCGKRLDASPTPTLDESKTAKPEDPVPVQDSGDYIGQLKDTTLDTIRTSETYTGQLNDSTLETIRTAEIYTEQSKDNFPKTDKVSKVSNDGSSGITVLKCVILFGLGIWLGATLPAGANFMGTIPGGISITLVMTHRDSKVPLFISFLVGGILGAIFASL